MRTLRPCTCLLRILSDKEIFNIFCKSSINIQNSLVEVFAWSYVMWSFCKVTSFAIRIFVWIAHFLKFWISQYYKRFCPSPGSNEKNLPSNSGFSGIKQESESAPLTLHVCSKAASSYAISVHTSTVDGSKQLPEEQRCILCDMHTHGSSYIPTFMGQSYFQLNVSESQVQSLRTSSFGHGVGVWFDC